RGGDVAGDRFDLRDDQLGRDGLPGGDAEGVLGRDRGDGARAVDAARGKRFEVCLDGGAAAGGAAHNCQCRTHTVQFRSMTTRLELVNGTLLDVVSIRADLSSAYRAAAVLFVTLLTIVAAQISIPLPFTPVPFTLQPMVVLLGGGALGSGLGMSSQALYLFLGVAGLPVFAASPVLPQGFARLLGPTGGYLLSYPFAAFAAGWLGERSVDRRYPTSLLALARGV